MELTDIIPSEVFALPTWLTIDACETPPPVTILLNPEINIVAVHHMRANPQASHPQHNKPPTPTITFQHQHLLKSQSPPQFFCLSCVQMRFRQKQHICANPPLD